MSDQTFGYIVLISAGVFAAVWGCGGSARLALGVSASMGVCLILLERLANFVENLE